jgi:4'-phosphopantetheinyl transferase
VNAGAERIAANGRWPVNVRVWRVGIPLTPNSLRPMRQMLAESEQQHADRFHHLEDRARFIVARHSLRVLLGAHTGKAPQTLRFGCGAYGKPTLDGYPKLSFNVSHSGDHALIVISDQRVVGIDIECVDTIFDWQPLADVVCTSDERRAIMRLPERQQVQPFFRCWTAKEALLKTLGLGITEGLRFIAVNPFDDRTQRPLAQRGSIAAEAATLHFHWLHEIPGYVGCVAYGGLCDAAG